MKFKKLTEDILNSLNESEESETIKLQMMKKSGNITKVFRAGKEIDKSIVIQPEELDQIKTIPFGETFDFTDEQGIDVKVLAIDSDVFDISIDEGYSDGEYNYFGQLII